jgi:hypothetical protein
VALAGLNYGSKPTNLEQNLRFAARNPCFVTEVLARLRRNQRNSEGEFATEVTER